MFNFLNQPKNIPMVHKSKFEANRLKGSWVMIGHTSRRTDITTLYIYRFLQNKTTKFTNGFYENDVYNTQNYFEDLHFFNIYKTGILK